MRVHWTGLLLVGSAVAGMALASGCSTQTKRQWLTFFFDGVPPSLATTTATRTATSGTNAQAAQATSTALALLLHPPYAEGKCIACHESKYSQTMRANLGDSCLGCHKDLLVTGKTWHAPAAAGECVVCHEPHQSSHKFLLKEFPNLLCAQCHAASEMATVAAHQENGKADCTTCHDPHQSGNKFLLKPKAATTGGGNPSESGRAGSASPGVPAANLQTPATNTIPLTITNGVAASAADLPSK